MKLALHRSVSFWSGLLVMAFVCWAWQDSTRWVVEASRKNVALVNGGSGISLCRVGGLGWKTKLVRVPVGNVSDRLGRIQAGPPLFLRNTDDAAWEAQWQMPNDNPAWDLFLWMQFGSAKGDWHLYIPHWLILLAVAVLWLGLLIWRARRRSRPLPHEAAAP